ncbi:MAG: SDR family NAD(P)-dependent oxidoreductase, partial [Deltaproteobacteria bacterium]|nr:SDR family NAD(P)-dependent oxidoreductase [Deltaproteobacteria bacterium]
MTDFDGRRVLVTGAASGIGAACLEAFRAHGAHVVGVDRSV